MLRARPHIGKGLLAMAIALIAAPVVSAQTLRELRSQEAEQAALAEEARYTSSLCRTTIFVRIDWRSSQGWPQNTSLAASCDGALGALEWICRSADGRRRAQRINEFVCSGDGSGPLLSGDVLKFGADPGGNGFSETKAYLEENL